MKADPFNGAEEAFHRGDLTTASRICGETLQRIPNHAPATLLSGLIAAHRRDTPTAIDLFKRALELSPDDYVATTWLLATLRAAARYPEAIEIGERARKLWPDDADVLLTLSHVYLAVRDIPRAASCLEQAVKHRPKDAALHRRLGIAYELLGRDSDAADQFRKSIDLAPTVEDGYVRLGKILMGHGNFTQVLDLCDSALQRLQKSAQLHLLRAQTLRSLRDNEPAYEALDKAISLDPDIVVSAAMWLHEDGKFEDAARLFKSSIERKPKQGIAYFEIVKGKRVTEADRPMLQTMDRLLEDPQIPPKERAALHYGLGKASNDLREYETAMRHFDEGNRLNYEIYLSGREFDVEELDRNRRKIVSMFSRDSLNRFTHLGSASRTPIFIVGMIRSGTTLVEQIVASHRDVGGAGEQRFWVNELPNVVDLEAGMLDEARFLELRERYLEILRSFQPDSPRITDKMPLNFYCAGLLHIAYPNAPIIHVKRHPVDTALSIYMTDLAKPPEFAHNRRNIVEEYRSYQKIMDHWRETIPSSRLFEIQYEDLISDQETWTRKLLEFCGLDWDPACLEFHTNDRQVSTPSKWQVRQPIYRTSVEKWRHYEPWLGEFAELLTLPNPV
jgi:tetratricopeptide (TPR) repeat protein